MEFNKNQQKSALGATKTGIQSSTVQTTGSLTNTTIGVTNAERQYEVGSSCC